MDLTKYIFRFGCYWTGANKPEILRLDSSVWSSLNPFLNKIVKWFQEYNVISKIVLGNF